MFYNLKAEMIRKRLTAEELAKAVGMSNAMLSRKLNGKSEFVLDDILKIKSVLGVQMDIEELFQKD